ncbi:LysE family translocator [Brevibacterium yomogidense]|uniref:Transporter, LysE family n=1 Tax=Brevibacterium yomogidense TaxID=946573 RepID=A0A1X6XLD2_9MICO|nr:LysE family transporter [Brevibacterium yomogidense]SLM99317.1 transporter, LysE family [Brevibacterium yomogidense]
MDVMLLFAFWGLTTLLICTPGADWAYLITAGLRGRGVQAVLGMVVGHFAIALAVALGLAALVAEHAWMLTVISVAGGLYLLWLGTSALQSLLKERRTAAPAAGSSAAEAPVASPMPLGYEGGGSLDAVGSACMMPGGHVGECDSAVAVKQRVRVRPSKRAVALQGLSVSLLNPKVYLMFLALVPQFVSDAAPMSDAAQLIVLGMVHVLTCGLIYLAVSLGAGAILIARPRAATVVTAASGILMSVLGAVVIVDVIV